MNSFEYALGLLSLLVGLALADIALSLHKLIRHWGSVRWDGRVIVSTALVVVLVVRMWFSIWSIRDVGQVLVFPFYLSLFLELMVLFLLAASCLPDDPQSDCDLSTFYESNRRTLWTVFAVFQASFFLHWLYFRALEAATSVWVAVLAPLAAYVVLIFMRNRALHYALPLAIIGWELYFNWSRSLGGPLGE